MRVNRRGRLRGKSNAGARVSTRLPPALRASRHSVIHWVILFYFVFIFGEGGGGVWLLSLLYFLIGLFFFGFSLLWWIFVFDNLAFFAFVCTYSMLYCDCAMCIMCIIYQYFLCACFIRFISSLFPFLLIFLLCPFFNSLIYEICFVFPATKLVPFSYFPTIYYFLLPCLPYLNVFIYVLSIFVDIL